MRFNQEQLQKIGKEISNKVEGKTLFDEFSRGRYSTDASVYQIKPLGVVLPKDTNDVLNIMDYSQKNSIPLLARGGGSSQCGQTVGESIVLDYSKHQNKILEINLPIENSNNKTTVISDVELTIILKLNHHRLKMHFQVMLMYFLLHKQKQLKNLIVLKFDNLPQMISHEFYHISNKILNRYLSH